MTFTTDLYNANVAHVVAASASVEGAELSLRDALAMMTQLMNDTRWDSPAARYALARIELINGQVRDLTTLVEELPGHMWAQFDTTASAWGLS